MSQPRICLVAIARDEDAFVEEWVVYHRTLGVERFVIYDDDPALPLARVLRCYGDCVEIVPWHNLGRGLAGRNRQTKAYWHWVTEHTFDCDWVGFVDIDEFVQLSRESSLPDFLTQFGVADAVSLQWHVFGHNGHFDDPCGLVIEALTRRMATPSRQFKTFTRPAAIEAITSAHSCMLKPGCRHLDANGQNFSNELYDGITAVANINHYQCRSFSRWMRRVGRGDVAFEPENATEARDAWRVDPAACLRHFVETVALDKNERVDTAMLRHVAEVKRSLVARRCGEHSESILR